MLRQGGPACRRPCSKVTFVDDEVDVVVSRFPQLILVSREKMYSPSPAPMIYCRTFNTSDGIHMYKLGVATSNV
jgi:hypothetical protein